jgi:hypothetical protein
VGLLVGGLTNTGSPDTGGLMRVLMTLAVVAAATAVLSGCILLGRWLRRRR